MNQVNKYKAFLESITDEKNKELMSIITEGFDEIHGSDSLKDIDSVDVKGIAIKKLIDSMSDIKKSEFFEEEDLASTLEGSIYNIVHEVINEYTNEGSQYSKIYRPDGPLTQTTTENRDKADLFHQKFIDDKEYAIKQSIIQIVSKQELFDIIDSAYAEIKQTVINKLISGGTK